MEFRNWRIVDYEKVTDFLGEHHREEGYTTNEIADATGVSNGLVSYILPKLYENGVVAKYKCKTEGSDRSKTWYALVSRVKESSPAKSEPPKGTEGGVE